MKGRKKIKSFPFLSFSMTQVENSLSYLIQHSSHGLFMFRGLWSQLVSSLMCHMEESELYPMGADTPPLAKTYSSRGEQITREKAQECWKHKCTCALPHPWKALHIWDKRCLQETPAPCHLNYPPSLITESFSHKHRWISTTCVPKHNLETAVGSLAGTPLPTCLDTLLPANGLLQAKGSRHVPQRQSLYPMGLIMQVQKRWGHGKRGADTPQLWLMEEDHSFLSPWKIEVVINASPSMCRQLNKQQRKQQAEPVMGAFTQHLPCGSASRAGDSQDLRIAGTERRFSSYLQADQGVRRLYQSPAQQSWGKGSE